MIRILYKHTEHYHPSLSVPLQSFSPIAQHLIFIDSPIYVARALHFASTARHRSIELHRIIIRHIRRRPTLIKADSVSSDIDRLLSANGVNNLVIFYFRVESPQATRGVPFPATTCLR
jgi:hypothetical protein